ncbi:MULTISPECIES: hypothetical protein [Ectopseudomonas]|uniref:Uncharacterized protein n=2 Tax=Ectopseudomonas TaxID=3236654 RepID=A0A1G6PQV7_9GAMM|nr:MULTISPECIES: hypothetical protein [Pseudomonas]ALN21965.1 hypothetical protein DW68_025130 [Pseudomonas mendocina S5.2]KER97984.1 hypothetical protein HN51_24555 [Pseudomonas mendocina]MBP3061880.1 hypothetical protein [Pseudomonas chengduensis]NNB75172.1 hypothetical protein [Pseudomonas chengduensis]OEO24590.1 hypothetical protein AX279_18160 [Pseudomonas sp. J237]
MTYKADNGIFDSAIADVRAASANTPVNIPWAKGLAWNAVGKVDAMIVHAGNALGVARNTSGDIKLYYGREHAGMPLFAIWGAWRSVFVAAALIYLIYFGYVAGKTNGTANIIGFLAGLAAFFLFAGKATYAMWAAPIYNVIGKKGYVGALWIAVFATLVGVSAMLGSGMRIWEGGVRYTLDIAGVIPDITGRRGIADVLSVEAQRLHWMSHSPVSAAIGNLFYTGLGLAVVRGAAWVFDRAFFVYLSRHSAANMVAASKVPSHILSASGVEGFAYANGGASGGYVILCGAAMLVGVGLMFLAY